MKGCKNCPAFAKCTVTYRGSGCAALRSTYGVETDPEIITNADRIRGMDDNELADFIDRCEAAGYNDSSVALDKNNNLMDTLDWLQQPSEEER